MSPISISGGYRFGFQAEKHVPPRLHAADLMKFCTIEKFVLNLGVIIFRYILL